MEKRWKLPYTAVALPLAGALAAFVFVLEKIRPWTVENQVALTGFGMVRYKYSFNKGLC